MQDYTHHHPNGNTKINLIQQRRRKEKHRHKTNFHVPEKSFKYFYILVFFLFTIPKKNCLLFLSFVLDVFTVAGLAQYFSSFLCKQINIVSHAQRFQFSLSESVIKITMSLFVKIYKSINMRMMNKIIKVISCPRLVQRLVRQPP